jgi:hypothetical protein
LGSKFRSRTILAGSKLAGVEIEAEGVVIEAKELSADGKLGESSVAVCGEGSALCGWAVGLERGCGC